MDGVSLCDVDLFGMNGALQSAIRRFRVNGKLTAGNQMLVKCDDDVKSWQMVICWNLCECGEKTKI